MFIDRYLDEDFMIWIDTCSILHEQFQVVMDSMSTKLLSKKSTIYITSSVNNELKKHAVSRENDLKEEAKKALSAVNGYLSNGILTVYNQKSNNYFADNDILTIFTELRLEHNLLLITQDKNLSCDIWALEKSKAVRSQKIRVAKITLTGELELFKINDNSFTKGDSYEKNTKDFFGFNFDSWFGHSDENVFCEGNILDIVNGDVEGSINGNVLGVINGNVEGDINGDVLGVICGDVEGSINGNVLGMINGDVEGDIDGDVLGVIYGDVEGDITGNVSGIVEGDILGKIMGNTYKR